MEVRRLFPESGVPPRGERIETLLARSGVRIERILSAPGSASGPYDQERDEWVLLLQGRALLEVEGERVELDAGEALWLPARRVHSVLDTSEDPPCVWLAVHIDPD
jgi:cupin 2 domain-containing protein